MGFSRQEYWTGLLFPSLGELLDPEVKLTSPALVGEFFTADHLGICGRKKKKEVQSLEAPTGLFCLFFFSFEFQCALILKGLSLKP